MCSIIGQEAPYEGSTESNLGDGKTKILKLKMILLNSNGNISLFP